MARHVEKPVRLFKRASTFWVSYILKDEDLEYVIDHLPSCHKKQVPHRDRLNRVRISLKTSNENSALKAVHFIEDVLEKAQRSRGNQMVLTNVIRHLEQVHLQGGSRQPISLAQYFDEQTEEEIKRSKSDTRGWLKPLDLLTSKRYQSYRSMLNAFLQEEMPKRESFMDSISPKVIRKFLNWLSARGYQNDTLIAIRGHLSGLWRKAIRDKHCVENPWDDPSTKVTRGKKRQRPILSYDQVRPVLELPSNTDNNALIFMLLTGCRPSDTVGILRADIHWDKLYIETPQSKVDRSKGCIIVDELLPIIERQLELHDSLYLFPRWNRTTKEWVRADRHYAAQRWNRRLKKTIGPQAFNKMFRYTFRTRLDEAGVSNAMADDLMGHVDPEVGQRHYIHHKIEGLRPSAQKTVPFITGPKEKKKQTGETADKAAEG